MSNHNIQKIMTSNEVRLIVSISDIIISEGISYNISQKPRLKKVINLARNVSKCYQPPNGKIIPKDIMDIIHNHNK